MYRYITPRYVPEDVTHTYKYIASGGNWRLPSLSLTGQEKMLIEGNTTLYVEGTVDIKGGAACIILAPGAKLKLYLGGDAAIGGGGMVNEDDKSYNMLIYGLEGCKNIDLNGCAYFCGGILAPNAALSINGQGTGGLFVGAATADTVTTNGGVNVAGDDAMGDHLEPVFYAASRWKEEDPGTTP